MEPINSRQSILTHQKQCNSFQTQYHAYQYWDLTPTSQNTPFHNFIVMLTTVTEECRSDKKNVNIFYGTHPTIFGDCVLGLTTRGIVYLSFNTSINSELSVNDLRRRWPNATFHSDDTKTKHTIRKIFSFSPHKKRATFNLLIHGTAFQLNVWKALLQIPEGHVTTYQHIANFIGRPKAVRAVGTAIGTNPVSFLLPCHRVIQKTGKIGNYRWGSTRKKMILEWEAIRYDKGLRRKK